ncbi:MAG: hypothetical protein IKP23_00135 [Elusimicrobiaceae bacterium]|nr:hypothetical protein [Elusimicrobiaceae bacterium]
MLAPILAAIIIILLIIYAAYPLLISKEFHGWANIALTALILFTVIVVLFVILGHQKGNRIHFKTIPHVVEEATAPKQNEQEQQVTQNEQTTTQNQETSVQTENTAPAANPEEITDEEALMIIAREYVEAEEAFKAKGDSDYQQKAAQQIIDRYDFTNEDWQTFLEDAARYDLFNKVKAEIK